MTAKLFQQSLQSLTSRRPFKPFVTELVGGERLEVDYPNATAFGETRAAVFVGPGNFPHIFDSESVLQYIDAAAHRPKKTQEMTLAR